MYIMLTWKLYAWTMLTAHNYDELETEALWKNHNLSEIYCVISPTEINRPNIFTKSNTEVGPKLS